MILGRNQYSSAPPPRSRIQDNPTLLVSWWCTSFALAIIVVRLSGRYIRTERLFREDKIMAWSIIPLLVRMGLVHVILLWGTNNTTDEGLTQSNIRHREIGSRLVLMSRIMYALFIWIAKFTITEFLRRLTSHVWKSSYEWGLQIIRWFLIVTFAGVVIATLAECQPFNHYWQVAPDPGPGCRQGMAQLYTMGGADIITDLLIVGFPIPIVLKSAMALQRKISLILLFALSLILVGVTIWRMQGVTVRHYSQQYRSLFASLEILAAAAVSNALVLGSFVRDRGTKKQRFRFGSSGNHSSQDRGTSAPRRIIAARTWGSDADLVGDLGMRLDPELTEKPSENARPAPIASPSVLSPTAKSQDVVDQQWAFPEIKTVETDQTDLKSPDTVRDLQPLSPKAVPGSPRRMSFFDVGGLLENDLSAYNRSRQASIGSCPTDPQDTSAAPSALCANGTTAPVDGTEARRGSHALLQDIGGLVPPTAQRSVPKTQRSGLIEALNSAPPDTSSKPSRPPPKREKSLGFQDVGGLLS